MSTSQNNQTKDKKQLSPEEELLNRMEDVMFTRGNVIKYNEIFISIIVENIQKYREKIKEENNESLNSTVINNNNNNNNEFPTLSNQNITMPSENITITENKKYNNFTPHNFDKLFWCFYIILNGLDNYEINKEHYFETEKNFKIKSVEKLRKFMTDSSDIKSYNVNEIEDELVNQKKISLKTLHCLCVIYGINIIYTYDNKYYEFIYDKTESTNGHVDGIIFLNNNKEPTLKLDFNNEYISNIRKNYWQIESVAKPLKSPSAYNAKEIQDICSKLNIPLNDPMGKKKTKPMLYEDILKTL